MSSQGPSSTSSSGPPAWLQDYARTGLDAAFGQAQQPYIPYQLPRVADLSPTQNQALQGVQELNSYAPGYFGAAANSLGGMLGGNLNPFTSQAALPAIQQATDAFNAATRGTTGRFNTAGNFGSTRHGMADEINARGFGTALMNSLGPLYSNAYDSAQNRTLQATSGLGGLYSTALGGLTSTMGLGNVQRAQQQSLLDSLYNDFNEQRQYPWTQMNNAAGIFSAMNGGVPRTQTTQQGYDPVSQGIGLAILGNSKVPH